MKTFVDDIIEILKNKQLTIATCESITAGMIVSNLVNTSGASQVVKGGLVTYSNKAKVDIAKVKEQTLKTHGAISKQVAIEMAEGAILKFRCDIAISITGNAGPNPHENKPIGLAYCTIIIIDKAYTYELQSKENERNAIRIDLTYQTLSRLLDLLKLLK
jgi:PncC family amidohydrolase